MSALSDGSGSLPYGIPPEGHRLPADTHLGPVRLQVADLDRSTDFYQRVLGLDMQERDGAMVVLTPGTDASPLIELYEKPGATPVPPRGRLGLYHFAVLLPDRAALGRFAVHLTGLDEPVGAADHRVSEAFYLKDPDGLGVEVYADRPRASWRQDGRQLVMATDPLDVDAVAEAAGGQPWTGAPKETVIGHVHLHVGDLDRAEEFYHRGLGLDKVVWSYPGALFLSAGGYHHHLGVNTWARGAGPVGGDAARLLEWEVRVPSEVEAARTLESLEAAGHAVEQEGEGGVVRDPWGTAVRVRPESR